MLNWLKLQMPLLGKIEILISDIDLYIFTKRQLEKYIIDEYKDRRSSNEQVILKYEYKNQYKELVKNLFENKIIISRNLRLNDKNLCSIEKKRFYTFSYQVYKENNVILSQQSIKYLFFYNRVKKFLGKYAFYHNLFYELVWYPILNFYTLFERYKVIHGSVVRIRDKNIILTGLDGVGKSTLALSLVAEGGEVLSDNFILYNNNTIVPFLIPLRISVNEISPPNSKVIFQNKILKEIAVDMKVYRDSVRIDKIFLLAISGKTEMIKIRSLNSNTCWDLINNGANEICAANRYAVPMHFYNLIYNKPEESFSQDRRTDSYYLGIAKGQMKDGKEMLLHEIFH